jgi:hypothetical protein
MAETPSTWSCSRPRGQAPTVEPPAAALSLFGPGSLIRPPLTSKGRRTSSGHARSTALRADSA